MCRNIKTLYNSDPPATDDEIHAAALQYVRKISGFRAPAGHNAEAFGHAGPERLQHHVGLGREREHHLDSVGVLEVDADGTTAAVPFAERAAPPKNREVEAAKAHARAEQRFGPTRTADR